MCNVVLQWPFSGERAADGCNLVDKGPTGRERPWRAKKVANLLLAQAYEDIDHAKAVRLASCASQLVFYSFSDGRKRLKSANFCRVRLCPMCSWRRALKTYGAMRKILAHLSETHKYAYLFLTLTVRNCHKEDLSDSLDLMMAAWNRFRGDKRVIRACRGWFRACEVTHNVDYASPNFDTYHPHFHVLLAVNPSYFASRDYLSQDAWVAIWKRCLGVDYDPVVDVRRVRGDDAKAVAEVCKYSVKEDDFILPYDWDLTVDSVRVLDAALHHRRFVAYGGVFKEVKRLLSVKDGEDDDDLVHCGDDQLEVGPDDLWTTEVYAWYSGYRQVRHE